MVNQMTKSCPICFKQGFEIGQLPQTCPQCGWKVENLPGTPNAQYLAKEKAAKKTWAERVAIPEPGLRRDEMTRKQVDLNKLRDTLIQSQRNGDTNPSSLSKTIVVDQNGRISMADDLNSYERQSVSEVQQDTFHSQDEPEEDSLQRYMPTDTQEITTEEGVQGWLFTITNSQGIKFRMFTYNDGQSYRVMVVDPVLESNSNLHELHLNGDGTILFQARDSSSSIDSLVAAQKETIIWAESITGELVARGNS